MRLAIASSLWDELFAISNKSRQGNLGRLGADIRAKRGRDGAGRCLQGGLAWLRVEISLIIRTVTHRPCGMTGT
jgi:hypothetical protein